MGNLPRVLWTDGRRAGHQPRYSALVQVLIPYATALVAALLGVAVGAYVTALVPRAVGDEPLLRPLPRLRPRGLPRSDAGVLFLTAAVFAALAVRFGPSPALPAYLYLAGATMALAVIDIRTRRLPDAITLPSYPIGLALLAGAAPFVAQGWTRLVHALIGTAVLYTFYLVLFLIYPKGMGFGDVKLAGVLGLYLGWLGLDTLFVGAFLGYLLGGVYGLAAIAARHATRKTAIPFGPFMVAGALLGVLVGDRIAALYLTL